MVFQPVREIFFDVVRPPGIDLARRVSAFTQTGFPKLIPQTNKLRRFHNRLSKMWRDKNNAILFSEDDISRHDRRLGRSVPAY